MFTFNLLCMKFLKIPSLAVTSLLLAVSSATGAVTTGEAAPDFTLTCTHGNSHSLSDFSGKFVVLEWINHECPFVVKFYRPGEMQRLQEKWTGKGVVWLAINSTNPSHQDYKSVEEANRLNEKFKVKHTALLMDEDGTVGRKYGARTTPHLYIINPEGKLIYQGGIDSIRSANSDDIPRATNYVDVALRAVMAGESFEHTDTRPYGCTIKY